MTFLQYISTTVYRYYTQLLTAVRVVVPIQLQSAIFIDADFRNPKTLSDVDFRNPSTLTNAPFRNPKTLTDGDFTTVTEVI